MIHIYHIYFHTFFSTEFKNFPRPSFCDQEKTMEGLIKGLVNVALGIQDNNEDNSSPRSRNERSRSTWAEVVSGEDEQKGEEQRPSYNRQTWNKEESEERNDGWGSVGERNQWQKPHKKSMEKKNIEKEKVEWLCFFQQEGAGSNDGWETVGERPQRQKQHKEEAEGTDDTWETVAKKPPRQKTHKVSMDQWGGYKRPLSDQEYAKGVSYGSEIEPSQEELNDLSKACNKLWGLDSNRLVPGKDYEIDCGDGKKTYQKEDAAQGSLFSWLSEDVFSRPTYSRFCSLLDNYNPNEGIKEVVTSQERQEQAAFVEEISRTAPIKYLHQYIVSKGVASDDYEEFKRMMIRLWFDIYSRGGTSGSSSAFEHVFVGEVKQRGEQEVTGFHNWIQFYLEEAKGRVDYQGYIFPRRRGQVPDSETQLLTIQFEWNGVLKSVSSTLVGVSPEFEIALYTLCFLLGEEDNYIQLGPYPVNIKCYRLGRDKIGSVFPIAQS